MLGYTCEQANVAVNVSVTDLHAQAAQLLASVGAGDVIEGTLVDEDGEEE